MKVAISTDKEYVSPHFGRCEYYTIVEVEQENILKKEKIPNPGHQPGFLPSFLAEKGVNTIIAGGMGRRAQGLFAQKNIEAIIGVQGKVDDVIDKFVKRELEAGEDLCEHENSDEDISDSHDSQSQGGEGLDENICITSQGNSLESEVDPRFGRARYFLIVNPETMNFDVVENSNIDAAHGAGIQSSQLVANKNIKAVLTGNCGPKAFQVLQSSGIKIVTGISGKVKDAVEKYKEGDKNG